MFEMQGALDPKGHNKHNCPGSAVCEAVCEACGSSDHRNAKSFECPEHKCTKCKGTLDPKGHNKNNCPEMLNTICTLCEEVGRDEKRCPTKPCPACGNRTHKSPMHFESCPEHIYAQRAARRVTIARTVQLLNVKHAVSLGTFRTIARL